MKTISLEILEKSELPAAQAHAILKVMESELASAQEPLATKGDLLAVKADLLAVKTELKADILAFRNELIADILNLRAEMKAGEGALSRWVLTCILGQTVMLAGMGYFAIAHLVK